jgi:hypothetical protein
MRKIMFAAAIGFMAVTGVATAESQRQATTYVCLDTGGASRGAICERALNSSQDDFCRCPANTDKVKVAVCEPGQTPPSQSASYERAMHVASSDGSLLGDTYGDQAMCVKDTKNGRTR